MFANIGITNYRIYCISEMFKVDKILFCNNSLSGISEKKKHSLSVLLSAAPIQTFTIAIPCALKR